MSDIFFNKKKSKAVVQFSIGKKILMLSAAAMLPFLILAVVLLISMNNYSRTYDKLVSNMTIANNYNLNFKEEMDESLYKLVVGYVDYENIWQDETLKDPYILIGELREDFERLVDITTEPESRGWLESLIRNIDTLEKRVDDILESIRIGGQYDKNIEELDNNIYILTELIQENIQYYIYYQTKSIEAVTDRLHGQIRNFIVICGLLVVILMAFTIVMAFVITSGILRPVRILHDATQKIAEGDFSTRASVDSGDEIEGLSHSFNDMAEKMQVLIQKTKEDEQRMRWLDLRLLQEQINPHFLYNTLDTIVWLIEGNQEEEAVDMVVALSDFFRLVLSKGRERITLKEEKEHIKSYLDIQAVRYRDILEYEIRIDPSLDDYQILKLTLQPLVENALYHGIKYKRARGYIHITGRKEGEQLRLAVSDNGVGMEAADLEQLRRDVKRPCSETDKGFGLANVNERIHIHFGPEYGMQIWSEKGKGTTVELTIPAIKKGCPEDAVTAEAGKEQGSR
ncbi:MAG: sensor histidine kinase [Lachnospiraceae bacterium]|nr:sensor histidine kinase [Lachnospiraceae bacterium]